MPSHYDELFLQTWIKLNQSIFYVASCQVFSHRKGQAASCSSSQVSTIVFTFSSPTRDSTICPLTMRGHWWLLTCTGTWHSDSSSTSQPALPLASMSHLLWLLPSCENLLHTRAPMAVTHGSFCTITCDFLLCAKSMSLTFSKVCSLALPRLYIACRLTHMLITVWRHLFGSLISISNIQTKTEFIFSPESDFRIPITLFIHLLRE